MSGPSHAAASGAAGSPRGIGYDLPLDESWSDQSWVLLLPNFAAQWQYEMNIEQELVYRQQEGCRNWMTYMDDHQSELEAAYAEWRKGEGPHNHVVSIVYQGREYPIEVDFDRMTQTTTSIGGRRTVRVVQRVLKQQ